MELRINFNPYTNFFRSLQFHAKSRIKLFLFHIKNSIEAGSENRGKQRDLLKLIFIKIQSIDNA